MTKSQNNLFIFWPMQLMVFGGFFRWQSHTVVYPEGPLFFAVIRLALGPLRMWYSQYSKTFPQGMMAKQPTNQRGKEYY